MKVSYSPDTIEDLQRLVEFVENKNPFAARRVAIDLQEGIRKLKQFSQIGLPDLNASDPEIIRDLYMDQCTAHYLITDEVIYILRIWHGKENEKNL